MTFKNNHDYIDTLRAILHLGIEDADFVLNVLSDIYIDEDEIKYLCGMALIYAARYGHTETLKVLLNFPMINEEDFDIDTVEKEEGNSALLEAADNGYFNIVQDLIEANAYIDITNKKGNTPLICAVKMGYLDIVQALIDGKPDINLTNNKGNTALTYAVKMGYLNIVQALIQANAEIESVNKKGHTPLLEAVNQNNIAIAKYLISSGADIFAIDKNGKTAIAHASESKQSEMIKVLKENGAELSNHSESDDEIEHDLLIYPPPTPVLYSFQIVAPLKRTSSAVFANNSPQKKICFN